jgi:SAM-dependent methyltransferase
MTGSQVRVLFAAPSSRPDKSNSVQIVIIFNGLSENCRLSDRGPAVHDAGSDVVPLDAVARERYGARANFIEGGLETLRDIPATSADIVMALSLLHHLDDGEANELFREGRRILAPGGRIFTLDCVTVADHNPISRFLISHDRGKYSRTPDRYRALAAPFFSNISQHHRNDMLRVPYDHLLMTCS